MEAILKAQLPEKLDTDVRSYISSVCGTADDEEELSGVLGPLLEEHNWDAAKVNQLCAELIAVKKPVRTSHVLLAAPVNMKAAAPVIATPAVEESRRAAAGPDEAKLKALENRRERRKNAREGAGGKASLAPAAMVQRKENAQGKSRDIRLDNFDVAAAGVRLLEGASLQLLYGRRYGLVGRNGSGKSTLLRAISARELSLPTHLSILHVEQEVEGDDTPALASVLQADAEREELTAEEKRLTAGPKSPEADARLAAVYARLSAIEVRIRRSNKERASAYMHFLFLFFFFFLCYRRTKPNLVQPRFSLVWASRLRCKRCPQRPSRAAGACVSRSHAPSSVSLTCCCSTSRQICLTCRPWCGSRATSASGPLRSSLFLTTETFSMPSRRTLCTSGTRS